MITWKKISLVFLIAGLMSSPVAVSGQVGEAGLGEFEQEVTKSLDEAVTIWEQMYNWANSFWHRQIGWRLSPILDKIERWVNHQITILCETLREDAGKAEDAIKKEVGQASERVKKSVWQTILESVGIGGGK